MDVIWNSAVGIDIDCQHNPDNPYLEKSLLVFKDLEDLKSAFIVTTYLPEFRPQLLTLLSLSTYILSKFMSKFVDPYFWLTHNIHKLFATRQANKVERRDFFQLLIEARDENVEVENDLEKVEIDKHSFEKKMSFEEIEFNLVGFLLAGFETTSTALNYCFLILSTHPHEMEVLQNEIDSFFACRDGSEIDLEDINKLPYLDMFIKETLRMYPISSK
jgi:cytochrome P450